MGKEVEQISAEFREAVRGDVFGDVLHRAAYSTDASNYRIVPRCVVAPRDKSDVIVVVKYAAAKGVPVVARGGGSGLAGECLGSGIVFDMTRYMNRIIRVEDDGKSVVCEPGVVLGELNSCLAGYGRKIGPDPSSANWATVGGCVANNSAGAHSLEYGYISGYVESIETVLADGSLVEFKNDFDPEQAADLKAASIARECLSILAGKEGAIKKAMPKSKRNRCGYAIEGICHDGRVDLGLLLAGSEGTLGIFTEITLRTVALPAAKGLLQLEFESLEKMARAVPIIVESGAAACELMDKTLIDMALDALPEYRDILPAGATAVLLIEHTGRSQEQVKEKIEKTDSAVGAMASGRSVFLEAEAQERLWKSRKDAGPLLFRRKSRKHPTEFMEDTGVEIGKLWEYISGLLEIGKRYGLELPFYGHAGDGELHVRPYLDLGEAADVEKMRKVADEVFSLVWSLGGTISGEHADGLVRSAFVRRQYGDEVYELMCRIKKLFDPDGVMNPGKIINDDADVMVKNLRAEHKFLPERLKTELLFEEDELALELGQCYGCGLCLSRESGLRMCPVFRAMGGELSSSRGKANILGFWATGQLSERDFESAQFRKFLDLCINCEVCRVDCPSGVDISKVMCAARAQYVRRKGLRGAEMMLGNNRYLMKLGSLFAPVSSFVMRLGVFKWLLEKIGGVDSRRSMPRISRGTFLAAGRKYLAACEPIVQRVDKVAYFVDTYANYNDHELGFAVLDVLRANGIEVILPKQAPAPLPAIAYGDVKRAKKDLSYNVRHLAKPAGEGYKIVCSEPSAAKCLKEQLRHFVVGADARLVSENTYELMSYLLGLYREGKLKGRNDSVKREAKCKNGGERQFVYHLPCHLYAVGGKGASMELLQEICGVRIVDLDAGCCGLAGTFGMQKKNYELSSQIAARLKEALESAGTKNVLTECSACKMQIEHISDCVVRHPIKLLAEAYEGRCQRTDVRCQRTDNGRELWARKWLSVSLHRRQVKEVNNAYAF